MKTYRWALHAEWTKARTVPGGGVLVVLAVGLTIGVGAIADAGVRCPASGCNGDLVKLSLLGVQVGQAAIAALAVMMIGGEYSTGMIRTSLSAVPRRWALLAAKSTVVAGAGLVAGVLAAFGSVLIGFAALPDAGHPELTLTSGVTLRATIGSALYLMLIALLSLAVATLVRDPAVAVGAVLVVLYVVPILAQVIPDPDWQRFLKQLGPTTAGLSIQTTWDVDSLAIGPWSGLAVLTAWSVGGLLLAGAALRFRDN